MKTGFVFDKKKLESLDSRMPCHFRINTLKVQHGESTNTAGKVDKTIDPN